MGYFCKYEGYFDPFNQLAKKYIFVNYRIITRFFFIHMFLELL